MELVKIGEKNLGVKEFEGERVMTVWDISELHEKEARIVNQQFERNKKHLILGEDYFEVLKEEFSESQAVIQKIPNNVKTIKLFTESGYMMLVKSFKDDMSWKVQRQLVKLYFKVKEFVQQKNNDMEKFKNDLQAMKMISDVIGFTKEQETVVLKKICVNNGISPDIIPESSNNSKLTPVSLNILLREFEVPYGPFEFYRRLSMKRVVLKDLYKNAWKLQNVYYGKQDDRYVKFYRERFGELVNLVEGR